MTMDRRNFLKLAARATIAASMAGGVAYNGTRKAKVMTYRPDQVELFVNGHRFTGFIAGPIQVIEIREATDPQRNEGSQA